jgi:acyl carrier protein
MGVGAENREEIMISGERAYQLIQDTMSSLWRSGLIKQDVTIEKNTVLLGTGSPLDSLAFVTLVAELEDRLNRETGQDLSLVLDEIHEFNVNVPYLTAETLSRYMIKLTDKRQ